MKSLLRFFSIFITYSLLPIPFSHAQVQLSYDQEVFNFGHVGIGYVVQHIYKIPNIGTTPVRLTKLEITCDCTSGRILDSVIPPGDTGSVLLIFDSKDNYGPTNKSVKVHTNNEHSPEFELWYVSVVGQWYDGLKPDPISLFFLPGKTAMKFEIANVVHDVTKVDSIRVEDTLFTVKPVVSKASKNQNLQFEVSPNPNLKKGTYLGDFSVYIHFDNDTQAEPMILTTPVKIVLF